MSTLQCDVCGGKLIMDKSREFSKCDSCGVEYTMETMRTMFVAIDGEVKVQGIATVDKLSQNGETFMSLNEWDKAIDVFKRMTEEYPEDYRGWWGLVLCHTRGLSGYFSVVSNYYLDRAIMTSTNDNNEGTERNDFPVDGLLNSLSFKELRMFATILYLGAYNNYNGSLTRYEDYKSNMRCLRYFYGETKEDYINFILNDIYENQLEDAFLDGLEHLDIDLDIA